jgi:glycosyltransferase involved in cell wall biosynthesis
MKLMIASHYPLEPSRPVGGQDVVTQRLLRGLRAYPEISVQVFTITKESGMDRTWVQDGATIRVASSPSRRYVPRTFSDAALTVSAIRLANPDIVHVHTLAYAYAAAKSGYPVVMTMHSIAWREALTGRGVRKYLLAGLALYLERVVLNRLRHVIAISPNIAAYVRARSRAKVHEIPVATDPEFFEIPNLDAGERLLFVGQIYPRKGVLPLLKSLDIVRRKVPGVEMDIIGNPTDAKYLAELKAYIEQHKMSSRIRFLGRVDEATLKQAYAQCSILVLSSLEEGTPAVLLEAMAAGKPVVATGVGGVPHIVEDGSNGFVVPVNDVQGFADRIIILLYNRGLREQMGQVAREKAKRYRLEAVMTQTVEVYRDVVASGRRES